MTIVAWYEALEEKIKRKRVGRADIILKLITDDEGEIIGFQIEEIKEKWKKS